MEENTQKLVVEFQGPEEKIQELLSKLEEMIEKDEDLEIVMVAIRKHD